MKKKLFKIKNSGLPNVSAGKANDTQDFFNQIIKPQFANKELIKRTHDSLMDYIKRPDAIFVLRLYGSDSNKSYDNLRRGFLTQYPDGKKMVFCDNTFAMPFVAMRISGITYTSNELVKYMNDSSTRFGFGTTKEEKEIAFYNWSGNGININLNVQGWYLAHIIPVGKDFLGKNLSKYFPNPKREEWLSQINHIRSPKDDLTYDELSILKAHFLRLVHPLNSFIVPKRKLLAYDGVNIGEEAELINIVQNYLEKEFPEEFIELNKVLLASEKNYSHTSTIGEIIWDANESNIKKEKSKRAPSRRVHSTKIASANEIKEIYDIDSEENLENTLRSIGKQTFIRLYPLLKRNILITAEEIYKYFPEYERYTVNSQKTRLSSSRNIFYRGLEKEALFNIISSPHLPSDIRREAQQMFAEL